MNTPLSLALPAARSNLRRLLAGLVLVGLGVLRSSIGTRLDSFTVDEPWHVVAGTAYARSGDFRLNPEHPPLVKRWVGAAMPDDFVLRPPTALSEKPQERTWVEQTMFQDNDAQRAQAHARIAMFGLNAGLLFALGLLLWQACGWAWAAGTLAFLALEPTVGAHLPVVMTDLPLGLTLMMAVVAAGLLAARWHWRWAIVCGAAIGLALGAKHSALAGLLGIAGLLAIATLGGGRDGDWREVLRRQGLLLVCAAVALTVLWAHYGFHFHAAADGSDAFNRATADKIAEINLPHWRAAIAFADRWHLLPRAYLWGLADTVRTGLEGRSITEHFIWGTRYQGALPWFAWPAIVVAKLPLGLLLLTLLGAALAQAWQRRSRFAAATVALLFAASFAMTIREPRLWEYHNELVGGSAGAYRYFENEGNDLGQRFAEIRAFHDRTIAPSQLPMYSDYWMGEEQLRAAKLLYRRRVEGLDDTNVEGRYDGWFVYPMSYTLPNPAWDWDPKDVFKDLALVERFGNVGIWKGRQVRPQQRAGSLSSKVMDYIYKENGKDWALVARRLEEVVVLLPQKVDSGVELGNAYLRLGDGAHAIAAYRRLLEQTKTPLDPLFAEQLRGQIAQIQAGTDLAKLEPLRDPWLE